MALDTDMFDDSGDVSEEELPKTARALPVPGTPLRREVDEHECGASAAKATQCAAHGEGLASKNTLRHFAHTITRQSSMEHAVEKLVGWLKMLGHRRVILQSDGEPVMLKLKVDIRTQPGRGH
eukprot:6465323-Amphidinium_carterae.1